MSLIVHAGAIFLNLGLFTGLLTTIFFTFGVWIERRAIKFQVDMIAAQTINNATLELFGPTQANIVRSLLENSEVTGMEEADKQVKQSNNQIIARALSIVIPFMIISSLIGLGLIYWATKVQPRRKAVIRQLIFALIMLLSVAFVEICFSLLVSQYYMTTTAGWIVQELIQVLIQQKKKL